FPYALASLPHILSTQWTSPTLSPHLSAIPAPHNLSPAALTTHFATLTATDSKLPYFKSLQGHLFARGYHAGEIVTPLFADVAPALRSWAAEGLAVAIYSSGSVAAQKLLMRHTEDTGDLTACVSGWFDPVNAGPKGEATSYEAIAGAMGVEVRDIVFFSDSVAEITAARQAGAHAALVLRPGNPPVSESDRERLDAVDGFGPGEALTDGNSEQGRDGLRYVEAWMQGNDSGQE
ncbi:enolase-phosphatase E1, partial [Hypocenomyce scalaris]|nr:enolase-phosphatase E1 [Hypocenomyce scalaris]